MVHKLYWVLKMAGMLIQNKQASFNKRSKADQLGTTHGDILRLSLAMGGLGAVANPIINRLFSKDRDKLTKKDYLKQALLGFLAGAGGSAVGFGVAKSGIIPRLLQAALVKGTEGDPRVRSRHNRFAESDFLRDNLERATADALNLFGNTREVPKTAPETMQRLSDSEPMERLYNLIDSGPGHKTTSFTTRELMPKSYWDKYIPEALSFREKYPNIQVYQSLSDRAMDTPVNVKIIDRNKPQEETSPFDPSRALGTVSSDGFYIRKERMSTPRSYRSRLRSLVTDESALRHALNDIYSPADTVHHEMVHAQHFINPLNLIRGVQPRPKDKNVYRNLVDAGRTHSVVSADELADYLSMPVEEEARLVPIKRAMYFVPKYRERLNDPDVIREILNKPAVRSIFKYNREKPYMTDHEWNGYISRELIPVWRQLSDRGTSSFPGSAGTAIT